MRAVLTLVLAALILISGTAYAWDAHEVDRSGHHHELSSSAPVGSGHESQPHRCGHCCHMSSHLVAFINGEPVPVAGVSTLPESGLVHFPGSSAPAPLFRPPIA